MYWKRFREKLFREDTDETISEVCSQFLDERIPDDRVDGYGADQVNRKGEEERQHFDDCIDDERDWSEHVTEWIHNSLGYAIDECDECCRNSAYSAKHDVVVDSTKDDGGSG